MSAPIAVLPPGFPEVKCDLCGTWVLLLYPAPECCARERLVCEECEARIAEEQAGEALAGEQRQPIWMSEEWT